jgi:hypothetical protein
MPLEIGGSAKSTAKTNGDGAGTTLEKAKLKFPKFGVKPKPAAPKDGGSLGVDPGIVEAQLTTPLPADKAKVEKLISPPPLASPAVTGIEAARTFPIDALDTVVITSRAGVVFQLDGGSLDGMRVLARRLEDGDDDVLRLEFKIGGPSRASFLERLEQAGAVKGQLMFSELTPQFVGEQTVLAVSKNNATTIGSSWVAHRAPDTSTEPGATRVLEGKGYRLEFIPDDGAKALRGLVRLDLRGAGAEQGAALKLVTQRAGLQPVFAPPTSQTLQRFALLKLLWTQAPAEAKALAAKGIDALKIDALVEALAAKGIGLDRIEKLRFEEVAPGHLAPYDPTLAERLQAEGLRFAYSTVATPEHVESILRDGQKATVTRWLEGRLVSGMSSQADMITGGAEGVFSRLVTPAADKSYWSGRTYKIILDPRLLGRLDVWGWPGDFYGRSWQLDEKNFGLPLLVSVGVNSDYKSNNEIISPVGNGPRWIRGVVATNEGDRTKLLDALQTAGYAPPDGRTLEQFVVLSPQIDAQLLSKLGGDT